MHGNCTSEGLRNSWAGLESLARELEEGSTGLLDPSLFTGPRRAGAWRRAPTRPLPFDVIEQADRVLLMFDLPGIARNDVKIKVSQEGILTISVSRPAPQSTPPAGRSDGDAPAGAGAAAEEAEGAAAEAQPEPVVEAEAAAEEEKEEKAAEPQQTVVRLERPYGSFSRSIRLPKGVDADGIAAKMADGVLTLTIPKAARQQPPSVSISVE